MDEYISAISGFDRFYDIIRWNIHEHQDKHKFLCKIIEYSVNWDCNEVFDLYYNNYVIYRGNRLSILIPKCLFNKFEINSVAAKIRKILRMYGASVWNSYNIEAFVNNNKDIESNGFITNKSHPDYVTLKRIRFMEYFLHFDREYIRNLIVDGHKNNNILEYLLRRNAL